MKFPIGSRVNVYTYFNGPCKGTVGPDPSPDENTIMVKWDRGQHPALPAISSRVHVKACRLLKKKARRRVWVLPLLFLEPNRDAIGSQYCVSISPHEKWIEFVEVKKK